MSGRFITVEGCEGCGKSTLISGLQAFLQEHGKSVFITREPGGSSIGNEVRHILLSPAVTLAPLSELFLFLADRAQHVAKTLRPAIERGQWVLCDRYYDSTIAYQSYGRGLCVEELKSLNRLATKNFIPDLTLLLDLPVEMGLSRAKTRNYKEKSLETRFDDELVEFHLKVRHGFLEMAQESRFALVNANQSPEAVLKDAKEIIRERLL